MALQQASLMIYYLKMTMEEDFVLYIREVRKVPDISPAEEAVLVGRIRRNDQRAIYQLAEVHMKRVVDVAQQYLKDRPNPKRLVLLDLIQAGNTGLLLAARHYQSQADYGFWDYAEWWVRKEIEKLLDNS
jgi:DNA-directed RNA polymerase sigma subunit (sigma70/sigma32)